MRGFDWINGILPDELIMEIFRHIDSKSSRDDCSLVCKRWLRLERLSRDTIRIGSSASPDSCVQQLGRVFTNIKCVFIDERISMPRREKFGKPRYARRPPSDQSVPPITFLSDSGLASVADSFAKLEKLTLIWCSDVTNVGLKSFAEKCRSLVYLDLQGCYIGDEGLAAVGECCNCLEDLNLRFCEGLTDTGLVQLVLGCGKTLKSLGIAACARITDASFKVVGSYCKSLQSLSLDSETIHNEGLLAAVKGCSLMKVLILQCINITDEALEAVGSFCVSLESLALHNFPKVTDRSLYAIGNGCKKLKSLTLSDCYSLSSAGIVSVAMGCEELMHIEINGCHSIGTEGLRNIGKFCSQLSELALLYCQRIESDVLSGFGDGCKLLQALHLVDCSYIGDESICSIANGCKNLRKLHIRRCYEVGNEGIIAIGQNCKYLTELSLRFCDRIGDEALISIGQGCSLRHLNVSGCHQIGDAGITAIARGSPQLSSLDVSVLQHLGDNALMELGENCPLLQELVISHCRKITDIGLTHLAKCTMLETCHMVYCAGITATGVATVVTSCDRMKKVLVEKWKVSDRTRRRAGSIINYLCVEL